MTRRFVNRRHAIDARPARCRRKEEPSRVIKAVPNRPQGRITLVYSPAENSGNRWVMPGLLAGKKRVNKSPRRKPGTHSRKENTKSCRKENKESKKMSFEQVRLIAEYSNTQGRRKFRAAPSRQSRSGAPEKWPERQKNEGRRRIMIHSLAFILLPIASAFFCVHLWAMHFCLLHSP